MRRTALLAIPLVAIVAGGYLAGTVHTPSAATAAAEDPAQQGILVSGIGKVSGTPDVLRVQLGVEVHRVDVSTALRDANGLQNRIRSAVRRNGVDAKDMQTADVSIYPSYNNKGVPNGYQVTQSLTLKLRNLVKAGKTIGDAVTAGGNAARVQGVSFALEDNAALLEQARDAAFGEAKKKAQRYAQLSDRQLGAVELVSEQMPQGEQPMPYARQAFDAAASKAAEVPLDAGQSQVSVSVTVRWSMR
ncbi:MAG: SIMPL domain-containing protein [Frankiaceae bacterium]|nr:SIMPL domain-containing protein [Frankiaceae bacterium]